MASFRMTWMARIPRCQYYVSTAYFPFSCQQRTTSRWNTMISSIKQRSMHAQSVAKEHSAAVGNSDGAPLDGLTLNHHLQPHGAIELIFGPMFAGKTTELLKRVEHRQHQGQSVALVKSNKDDRYDLTHVVTHDGLKQPCYSVPSLAAFREAAGDNYHSYQVIAIDEAQFFTDLVEFCSRAADHDAKRIIVAGLDGDFQRRRFGQILDVIPFADTVTKLTAKCTYCVQEAAAAAATEAVAQRDGAASTPQASSVHAASKTSSSSGARRPMQPLSLNGSSALGSCPTTTTATSSFLPAAASKLAQLAQQHTQQGRHVAAGPHAAQGVPRPALFSLRIAADSRQEVVGGADKYAPVCRHHYIRLSQVRREGSDGGSP